MKRTKATVTTKKLFHHRRHPRAPLAVQDRADLWLSMYMEFAGAIVASGHDSANVVVGLAEDLANRSLDAFESRWPTAEVPAP